MGILVFRSLRNWAFAAALIFYLAPINQADAGEAMAAIHSAVIQFVRQHLAGSMRNSEIAVDVPAASVNFPTCTRLQLGYFGYANPFGNQTVAVHCQNPQAWTLYVPVQIRQGSKILIAAHSLSADSLLRAGDIAEHAAFPQAPPGSRTVVLDERGTALSSTAFAHRLGGWRDQGVREVRFLLGPADGHAEATRKSADLLLALGPATWPHLLARAMLAEQLYRACALLANHPYHRA